jgi:hypothetical protein
MKEFLFNKVHGVNGFLATLFLLCCSLCAQKASAQPGWEDHTTYYYYTILDDSGKEIRLKENEAYTIGIGNSYFSGESIPFDSLKPIIRNSRTFYNYININDLSFRTPLIRKEVTELKIILGKDTMHVNQPTMEPYDHGLHTKRTLHFLPGHYFFPEHTRHSYDRLPSFTNHIALMNVHQRNFLIPAALYREMARWNYDKQLKKKAEEIVFHNFTQAFLANRNTESIVFNKNFKPFKKPQWRGPLYASKDSTAFYGLVSYNCDTSNLHSTQSVFSTFYKSENKIEHWAPLSDMRLLWGAILLRDTFNNRLYLRHGVAKNPKENCMHALSPSPCPMVEKLYASSDEGHTWQEDELLEQVYNKHDFRALEFLDENHALAFTRRKFPHPKTNNKIQKGTYYLLENKSIIDSMSIPDSVHYNSNYERYTFSRQGDSVKLGRWGLNWRTEMGSNYHQPWLIKEGNSWVFKTTQEKLKPYSEPEEKIDSLRVYDNFSLYNEQKLVFNNDSGALILEENTARRRVQILEEGAHIYILESHTTLMSFNGGLSWYLYPKPLHKYSHYTFLETNQQQEISFFDFDKMEKIIYKFSLKLVRLKAKEKAAVPR